MPDTAKSSVGTLRVPGTAQTSNLHSVICAAVIACIGNGLSMHIVGSIRSNGLADAIASTFGVSIIVWFSIYNCIKLMGGADYGQFTTRDAVAICVTIIGFCFPLPSAAWVGLTVISIHFITKPDVNSLARRAFWVTLALSGSLQWAKWFSAIFMPTILEIDASLVAVFSGFPRYGNLVTASDGTTLQILEACSSFTNISLVFLGWINARSFYGTAGVRRGAAFISAMIAIVVLINTTRVALIAFRPDQYELIHGPIGGFVANTLITIAVITLSIVGARK